MRDSFQYPTPRTIPYDLLCGKGKYQLVEKGICFLRLINQWIKWTKFPDWLSGLQNTHFVIWALCIFGSSCYTTVTRELPISYYTTAIKCYTLISISRQWTSVWLYWKSKIGSKDERARSDICFRLKWAEYKSQWWLSK